MWKPGRDLMKVWCWFAGSDVSLANIESTPHCSRSVKYISSFQSFKNGDFSLAPCQVAEPELCSVYLHIKSIWYQVDRIPNVALKTQIFCFRNQLDFVLRRDRFEQIPEIFPKGDAATPVHGSDFLSAKFCHKTRPVFRNTSPESNNRGFWDRIVMSNNLSKHL